MRETTITTDPDGVPAGPPLPSQPARHGASRLGWAAAWAIAGVLAWIAFSRVVGITFPARFTVMLQALLPLMFLAAYPIGVVAFVRRRWALGGLCVVLVVVHVLSVFPALGSRSLPAWAASAPRVTILEANMYDENAEPGAAAARIMASGADVLVLVELNSRTLSALRADGVERTYPFSTVAPGRYAEDVIWSKRPLSDVHSPGFRARQDMPSATVAVDGRALLVVAVHVDNAIRSREDWSEELTTLRQRAAGAGQPVTLVGDFNATRWNPPFGDLLGSGLHDAHEATGQGLSTSWPNLGFPARLMRLDHALVNDSVGVVSVHDYTIPGSDHQGFVTELAIGT